jgi:hypothetical protein
MPAGRPLSLDADRRAAIGDVLAAGATIKTTTIARGVGERTLHRWLAKGLVRRSGEEPSARRVATPADARDISTRIDDLIHELRRTGP